MAILFALFAAAANAFATILQRLGVEEATPQGKSSVSLMLSVLRRPVWLGGLALTIASFLLQAIALSIGNLSTVQPIMVSEIVILVIVLGAFFHPALGWREWVGAIGTAAGLGLFLAITSSCGGNARPAALDWLLLLVVCAGAVFLGWVGGHHGPRWWRAVSYGIAAGISFALTAAFIKSVADEWGRGPAYVFTHFEAYGVAAAGLAGLVISQQALEAGPVAASQSALLIINPLSSIVMGHWLFGDHINTSGARFALEVLALALMFAALFVLSTSPLIAAGSEERLSPHSHLPDIHPQQSTT